mmetsp:Transcript_53069/g.99445  ORF Transcript_53069/g.99445 Transcript_53069/m.99445 type:complete len:268 (+) Transcript_53069:82-885(+)
MYTSTCKGILIHVLLLSLSCAGASPCLSSLCAITNTQVADDMQLLQKPIPVVPKTSDHLPDQELAEEPAVSVQTHGEPNIRVEVVSKVPVRPATYEPADTVEKPMEEPEELVQTHKNELEPHSAFTFTTTPRPFILSYHSDCQGGYTLVETEADCKEAAEWWPSPFISCEDFKVERSDLPKGCVAPWSACPVYNAKTTDCPMVLPSYDFPDEPIKCEGYHRRVTGCNPNDPLPEAPPCRAFNPLCKLKIDEISGGDDDISGDEDISG